MKISLLLQREPFGSILEQTLTRCLTGAPDDMPQRVKWFPHNPGAHTLQRLGYQPWYCNPLADAIFSAEASSKTRALMRRQYGWAFGLWQRMLRQTYMAAATHASMARWLAPHAVGIAPPLADAANIVIRGGLNRIRVFDYAKGEVMVVLKVGAPSHLLLDELQMRVTLQQGVAKMPTIVRVDAAHLFYVEPIVPGQVVSQLSDSTLRKRCIATALANLDELARQTLRAEATETLLIDRRQRIEDYLKTNSLLTETEKATLYSLTCALCTAITQYIEQGYNTVETAITHGDPLAGNILWNGADVVWVDWEFARRRIWIYDHLVTLTMSRQHAGLSDRLTTWIQRGSSDLLLYDTKPTLHEGIPQTQEARWFWALLFLLEEIAYYLGVDDNPLLVMPNRAFQHLPAQIEQLLRTHSLTRGGIKRTKDA